MAKDGMLRHIVALALAAAAWRRCYAAEAPLPKIAFLIVAHDDETMESAARLLDAIYDEENLYLVHVDAKYAWPGPMGETMAPFTAGRSNVEWTQLADVRWGRWSMNEPTLWAMGAALRSSVDWEVFINLSGDTWPVLTPGALRRTLKGLKHLNFLTSSPSCETGLRPVGRNEFGDGWHKKQAYPHPMLRDMPTLEAFYGSQWMILSRAFVDYVTDEIDTEGAVANRLREWFVNGTVVVEGVGRVKPHIPDETFFPSVLMASPFREAGVPRPIEVLHDAKSGKKVAMKASFYVRMDEHYPWSSAKQRYQSKDLDKKERPWGPYYLGSYDLGDIRDHRALFVRKTSRRVDAAIFDVLPVDDFDDIPATYWPETPVRRRGISKPAPTFPTVKRGAEEGCVRVAESIHCPPNHKLGDDVHAAKRLAAALSNGEL